MNRVVVLNSTLSKHSHTHTNMHTKPKKSVDKFIFQLFCYQKTTAYRWCYGVSFGYCSCFIIVMWQTRSNVSHWLLSLSERWRHQYFPKKFFFVSSSASLMFNEFIGRFSTFSMHRISSIWIFEFKSSSRIWTTFEQCCFDIYREKWNWLKENRSSLSNVCSKRFVSFWLTAWLLDLLMMNDSLFNCVLIRNIVINACYLSQIMAVLSVVCRPTLA